MIFDDLPDVLRRQFLRKEDRQHPKLQSVFEESCLPCNLIFDPYRFAEIYTSATSRSSLLIEPPLLTRPPLPTLLLNLQSAQLSKKVPVHPALPIRLAGPRGGTESWRVGHGEPLFEGSNGKG